MRPAHSTLRYLIDTETNRFYIQSPRIESQKVSRHEVAHSDCPGCCCLWFGNRSCIAVPWQKPPEANVPDSQGPRSLSLRAGQNSGSCNFVRWQTNPGFIQRHDLEAVCESGA